MAKKPITFTNFDAASYIRDEEDVAAYLAAASDEGDPAALIQALNTVARARNMTHFAADAGLTREGAYKALAETGNPGLRTFAMMADVLGYRLALVPKVQPAKAAAPRRKRVAA